MAAHDEKISQNRRKLFKALSAAPVVTTFSSGSALANASAHQCLANPPVASTPQYLEPLPAECSDSNPGANCMAYVERFYWDNDGLSGTHLQYWNNTVTDGRIVVLTDETTATLFTVNPDGSDPDPINTSWNYSVSGSNLIVPGQGGGATPVSLPGKTGYFLLEVVPNADLTGIQEAYAYPQATQDPLAQSCGTSLGVTATNGVHWVDG
ncbi:MAG: hypothetical protein KDJ27_13635 [Gammaproteobacteria bacterium]|nr:hypothetical protein [Gammaproteobacteria bacterium]MCB1924758.1 hypothetical protein [Gammaproteobacteria bacterium]